MNKKGSIHCSIDDRHIIEFSLNANLLCKDIASQINKNDRTVSKEIRLRRIHKDNSLFFLDPSSKPSTCKKLDRFPFVCNGCSLKKSCRVNLKYYYQADYAHQHYLNLLKNSRSGLDISLQDKLLVDKLLYDGIKNGQSIHHIAKTHKSDIRYSERSLYRLVDKNLTTIQSIDMLRKAKLKPRKHYVQKEDNLAVRVGRKYDDFIRFIANMPNPFVVEIDTVESVKKGKHKCLLTIHFTVLHFMLIFVLNSKSKVSVSEVFFKLQSLFGPILYKKVFPVILTDRGTEFCDPITIEFDHNTGEKLTHIFYCNSYSSYQKGAIEENHELIRRVIPKGIEFDDISQDKANILSSHINSYFRKSIDSTPYELAKAYFGQEFLDKLGIYEINPNDVTLKTKLLR